MNISTSTSSPSAAVAATTAATPNSVVPPTSSLLAAGNTHHSDLSSSCGAPPVLSDGMTLTTAHDSSTSSIFCPATVPTTTTTTTRSSPLDHYCASYSVSHAEAPVLESLTSIRNRLTVLKRDRNNYYRPDDIVSLYNQLLDQVAFLKKIRETEHHDNDFYKNRIDSVLDDCFQLFSLFYMALGKNREIPATYVQLVTIKQNLDLFEESGIYTQSDLAPFEKRLNDIRDIIHSGEKQTPSLPRAEVLLVERRYRQCVKTLERLQSSTRVIDVRLEPIYSRLVNIQRRLTYLRTQPASDEVRKLQQELLDIDNTRVNDRFVDEDGSPYEGQTEVVGLLEQCFEDVHDALVGNQPVPDDARPIYDSLVEIKSQLDKLLLTHRWTLRETDLWGFQVQLSDIDNMREHGEFHNADGEPFSGPTQAVLNYLLHKCYALLYKLLSSSEPVAESLMPVHNQLRTLRRCLMEVKKYGGPFTPRDLYPYQMKLASIDNLRVDGKFLDEEDHVPEGQGVVMSLLNECYDILYELMTTECDD